MDLNSSPDLFQQVKLWAERMKDAGCFCSQALDLACSSEASLFKETARPLVVAFFGGTGVGKSTLLNRLAQAEIAKTGIERPTSRTATVYLPAGVELQLPKEIADRVKTVFYPGEGNIAWVDLPDIDSLEQSNRELAFKLLPYIDVVVYVVSPERYLDAVGLRKLSEHKLNAAWLFVMNRFDEGETAQIEDFTQRLKAQGFADPIVLRCDSRKEAKERKDDDFESLVKILKELARSHEMEALSARNEHLKLKRLKAEVDKALDLLQDQELHLERLRQSWREIWQESLKACQPGIEWSAAALAKEAAKGVQMQRLTLDHWVKQSLLDALDRLALMAENAGLRECRRALANVAQSLEKVLEQKVQFYLRLHLAAPGSALERFGAGFFSVLEKLLPMAAAMFAAYQLLLGFYLKAYPGVDFAVSSLLLIALAWLIPRSARQALEPSLEKAAKRGIKRGFGLGLAQIESEVEQSLVKLCEERKKLFEEGKQLAQSLSKDEPAFPACSPLRRMLARPDVDMDFHYSETQGAKECL